MLLCEFEYFIGLENLECWNDSVSFGISGFWNLEVWEYRNRGGGSGFMSSRIKEFVPLGVTKLQEAMFPEFESFVVHQTIDSGTPLNAF